MPHALLERPLLEPELARALRDAGWAPLRFLNASGAWSWCANRIGGLLWWLAQHTTI